MFRPMHIFNSLSSTSQLFKSTGIKPPWDILVFDPPGNLSTILCEICFIRISDHFCSSNHLIVDETTSDDNSGTIIVIFNIEMPSQRCTCAILSARNALIYQQQPTHSRTEVLSRLHLCILYIFLCSFPGLYFYIIIQYYSRVTGQCSV